MLCFFNTCHLHFERSLSLRINHCDSLLILCLLLLIDIILHHFLLILRRLLLHRIHVYILLLHLHCSLHWNIHKGLLLLLMLLLRIYLLHHLILLNLHGLLMLLRNLLHLLHDILLLLVVHLPHHEIWSWTSLCSYRRFILKYLIKASNTLSHLLIASVNYKTIMNSKFREFHLCIKFIEYIGWLFNSIQSLSCLLVVRCNF